jgi:transcriptional regulator with XRE-family HTH domain
MLSKGPRNILQDKLIKTITRKLVEQRIEQGLSVGEVADKSGYAIDHLKKMECGNRNPSFNSLTAWANTLDCDLVMELSLKKRGVLD